MAELTIDLTYGTALFDAACEAGKKEQILEEANQVLAIFEQEPDLSAFINYPAISAQEKKAVINNIFEGRICDELLNFIYILIDKRRTMHFEKMIKVYKKLADKENGVSYGTVYSVEPLSVEHIAELEQEASKLFASNVKLANELDPKLMGGVKLLIDGRMIDMSIRKKFSDLKNSIRFDQGGTK
ncbi:MAG: ATP synthase F1 subunit delta [Bacillota bacterium]|nr:ATP synthase F1 subunit delta [Bacillota bacterium]